MYIWLSIDDAYPFNSEPYQVGFADQDGAAFRRSAQDDRLHTPRIPKFLRSAPSLHNTAK